MAKSTYNPSCQKDILSEAAHRIIKISQQKNLKITLEELCNYL